MPPKVPKTIIVLKLQPRGIILSCAPTKASCVAVIEMDGC